MWKRKPKYRKALWTTLPGYRKRLRKSTSRSKGLRPITPSRRLLLVSYEKQRRIFLKKHPVCELCKKKRSTDVHHVRGRGPYLLDETTWMALDRGCHDRIHQNVGWALKHGYLLSRLWKNK